MVRVETVVGSLQKVVPKELQATILYLAHYRVMEAHPSRRHEVYVRKMRLEIYWSHMANNVYATVRDLRSCSFTHRTIYTHRKLSYRYSQKTPVIFH